MNLPTMRETRVHILGSERLPGEGNGNPVQDSCLENFMDGGICGATVHGFTRLEHNWMTAAVAAAKLLQSCPTLCDPKDGSPPGSPSLGFSRQEYWSGLPFSSPVHESEKWKWSCSVVSDSLRPHGLQPTRLIHLWDFPGKSTGVANTLQMSKFALPILLEFRLLQLPSV